VTDLGPRLARPESPGAPVRVPVGSPTVLGMPSAHLRLAARVAVLAAMLVVVTSCGQASSAGRPGVGSGSTESGNVNSGGRVVEGSPGGVPPTPPSGGVLPAPPPGAPAPLPEPPGSGNPTPSVSDPVAGQRHRQVAWRLVAADPAARRVVVEAVVGGIPCDRVTGVEAAETASTVTVTVWAGPEVGATGCDGPQPALAQIVWVAVPLADVLGSRTLLSSSTS